MIKADFGEQLEDDNMLSYSGDSGMRLHNVYSLLYNRCVYEAAEKYSQNGPFLFSRSAWSGSQCYPSQWGGDPQADWGGLAASIRGALSWGMSGIAIFCYRRGRFLQRYPRCRTICSMEPGSGVFSSYAITRDWSARTMELWQLRRKEAANQALRLRYRLLPYIQSIMLQASESGLPLMRAMALAFPEDRASWAFEEQFMFGEDILVAPCLESGGHVEFYLPEGEWRCFFSGKVFTGGKVYQQCNRLEQMTVLVKQGAKIPLGPDVEHTEQLGGEAKVACYWPENLKGQV